jgi:multidrug efflux pump subunit AcrA (membrane-fusion protein)
MNQLSNPTPVSALHTPSEATPGREVLNHRPMPWLKPLGFAAAGVAAIVVAIGLLSRDMASQGLKSWTEAQAIPTVSVVRPDAAGGDQTLVLPGQVQAFNDAPIHARVPGYLKAWYHDIGDKVRAGALLADIDTPDLDQQLGQAKADLATAVANLALAQTTARRWNSLLSQDAVSRQEAEEKNGDLAAKTALVNAAKANLVRL